MRRIATALFVCALASHAFAQSDVSAPNVHADNSVSVGTTATSLPFFVSKSGTQLSGTAYYNARIEDPSSKGVVLGYDTSGQVGVISAIGASSSLAFWTHDGSLWGERFRIAGDRFLFGMNVPTASPVSDAFMQIAGTTYVGGEGGSRGVGRVTIGAASGDYGTIGYNYRPSATASGSFSYLGADTASQIYFLNGGLRLRTAPQGTGGAAVPFYDALNVLQNGDIGIGTTTPDAKTTIQSATGKALSLKDTAGNTRAFLHAQHGPTAYYYDFNSSNYDFRLTSYLLGGSGGNLSFWTGTTATPSERMRITPEGAVAIGVAVPQTRLHVGAGFNGDGVTVSGVQSPGVKLMAAPTASTDRNWGIFTNYQNHGDLAILKSGDSAASPWGGAIAMSLQSNGDAYFAGNVDAGGQIRAKFQDIAEWVPSTEPVSAGTVMIVAGLNHVSPSSESYDTRVAGVVSAQPGVVLGEAGDSKVMVATTGRVKVRVDATSGPIQVGDILVSSSVKGTAMKSEPLLLNSRKFHQPGTVIGKALEPLQGGTGEILVLLSLQ